MAILSPFQTSLGLNESSAPVSELLELGDRVRPAAAAPMGVWKLGLKCRSTSLAHRLPRRPSSLSLSILSVRRSIINSAVRSLRTPLGWNPILYGMPAARTRPVPAAERAGEVARAPTAPSEFARWCDPRRGAGPVAVPVDVVERALGEVGRGVEDEDEDEVGGGRVAECCAVRWKVPCVGLVNGLVKLVWDVWLVRDW